MIAFNVCSKHSFIDKENQERVFWNKIGYVKLTSSGKAILQLFQFPGVDYYMFEHNLNGEPKGGGELLQTGD